MVGKTFSKNFNPILTDIFGPIVRLLDQLEITHHTNYCNRKTEEAINFISISNSYIANN